MDESPESDEEVGWVDWKKRKEEMSTKYRLA